jgi:SAM-dependent methyltransferase
MLKVEATKRFSSRANQYARHRPSYPNEVITLLERECGLTWRSVVADVAYGTGLFTRLLLENGNRVYGVEPNAEMRRAGEEYLSGYDKFISINGTAEATTLENCSVDLITCAQAAHWFDREKALREFRRILKPGGFLALIWNDRRVEASAFDRDYEQLILKFGTDYEEVQRRGRASEGDAFLGSLSFQKRVLSNYQDLDYSALEGRLLSSSYVPQAGDDSYLPMLIELRKIFDAHQKSGSVRMEYDTKVYFGPLETSEQRWSPSRID